LTHIQGNHVRVKFIEVGQSHRSTESLETAIPKTAHFTAIYGGKLLGTLNESQASGGDTACATNTANLQGLSPIQPDSSLVKWITGFERRHHKKPSHRTYVWCRWLSANLSLPKNMTPDYSFAIV
jgi:hypothetical protein